VTVHVGIGTDIIHMHPAADGAAIGAASLRDFHILAGLAQRLDRGVFINLGTATIGPEVYLKALSMARSVARRRGATISDFTTAVFDIVPLPDDWARGTASKDQPLYYYRPWKTILVRTVADGGTSDYFRGDHRRTIPALWDRLTRRLATDSPPNQLAQSVPQ